MSQPLFADFPPVRTEDWEAKIQADLKGASYERVLLWHLSDTLRVAPYYRAEDLEKLPHVSLEDALPISALRGGATGSWVIEEPIQLTSERGVPGFEEALQADVGGLILEGSPHPSVNDAVIHAVEEGVSLSVIDATTASAWARMLAGLSTERDLSPSGRLSLGGLSLLAQGFDVTDDQIRMGMEQAFSMQAVLPGIRSIHLDACPIGAAGGSLTQSVAVILAQLHRALLHAREQEREAADVLPLVHVSLSVDTSFFPSIAILRALRLLAAQVAEAWGVSPTEQAPLFVSVSASTYGAGLYDPHVNLLRTTTQAMSAIMGGADAVVVYPYTVRSGIDHDGIRWARNIQHLLHHESHLHHVLDPGGGSYYLETLTDALAREAWETFQAIEQQGGWENAVRTGWLADQVEASHTSRIEALRRRKSTLLGTNQYPRSGEDVREEVRDKRPTERTVNMALFDQHPSKSSNGTEDANTFTVSRHHHALPERFASAPFDALRARTAAFEAQRGRPARVLLTLVGPPAMATARAQFALNFLGCAGFTIEERLPFESPDAAVTYVKEQAPDIAVLCSSDAAYADLAPAFLRELQDADVSTIPVLAGYPTDLLSTLQASGWQHFVHLRADMLETLQSLQDALGMP